jgi:hypothetical protein
MVYGLEVRTVQQLNMAFLETYKRLDQLCRDLYRDDKGVSSYIEHMKSAGARQSPHWNATLQTLIRLRHIRNQLTHEVGTLDQPLCTAEDIQWLQQFHHSIINRTDPIALLRKANSRQHSHPRPRQNAAPIRRQNDHSETVLPTLGLLLVITVIIVFIYFVFRESV